MRIKDLINEVNIDDYEDLAHYKSPFVDNKGDYSIPFQWHRKKATPDEHEMTRLRNLAKLAFNNSFKSRLNKLKKALKEKNFLKMQEQLEYLYTYKYDLTELMIDGKLTSEYKKDFDYMKMIIDKKINKINKILEYNQKLFNDVFGKKSYKRTANFYSKTDTFTITTYKKQTERFHEILKRLKRIPHELAILDKKFNSVDNKEKLELLKKEKENLVKWIEKYNDILKAMVVRIEVQKHSKGKTKIFNYDDPYTFFNAIDEEMPLFYDSERKKKIPLKNLDLVDEVFHELRSIKTIALGKKSLKSLIPLSKRPSSLDSLDPKKRKTRTMKIKDLTYEKQKKEMDSKKESEKDLDGLSKIFDKGTKIIDKKLKVGIESLGDGKIKLIDKDGKQLKPFDLNIQYIKWLTEDEKMSGIIDIKNTTQKIASIIDDLEIIKK